MRDRRCKGVMLVLCGVFLWGAPVRAESHPANEADQLRLASLSPLSPPELAPSPVDALVPPQAPVALHLELTFVPRWHTGREMQTVYPSGMYQLELAGRYRVAPELSARLGVAYARQEGLAVGAVSGAPSDELTELLLIPLELGLTYHLEALRLSSVTPYLSAGLNSHLYRESSGETEISGAKWGYHARVGLDVRLEGPAPAWTSDARSGIRTTSLLLEVGYSGVKSFRSVGLDLSGILIQVGFALGF